MIIKRAEEDQIQITAYDTQIVVVCERIFDSDVQNLESKFQEISGGIRWQQITYKRKNVTLFIATGEESKIQSDNTIQKIVTTMEEFRVDRTLLRYALVSNGMIYDQDEKLSTVTLLTGSNCILLYSNTEYKLMAQIITDPDYNDSTCCDN